jgi:hypothetical protein
MTIQPNIVNDKALIFQRLQLIMKEVGYTNFTLVKKHGGF